MKPTGVVHVVVPGETIDVHDPEMTVQLLSSSDLIFSKLIYFCYCCVHVFLYNSIGIFIPLFYKFKAESHENKLIHFETSDCMDCWCEL